MTDKEKRELKDGVISIFNRFNIRDHTATIGGLRDDILRYINSLKEEPASEYSFNIQSELFQQLTPKQQKLWKKEIEQAYNAGMTLQEEIVSEDLEEAADKYESEQQEKYNDRDNHDFDNYRDGFVDGLTHTYDAFKAGSKWHQKKDKRWLADNHKQTFNNRCVEGFEDDRADVYDELKETTKNLKKELNKYIKDHFTIDKEQLDRFGVEEKDYMYSMDRDDMLKMLKYFVK